MTRLYNTHGISGCEVLRRSKTSVTGTGANSFGYRSHGRMIHVIYTCIVFIFLSFSVQAEEKQNYTTEIVPEKLVDILPWSFNLTRDDLSGKNFPYLNPLRLPDSLTGYRFISSDPIQKGNSGRTYLRISFYSGRYANSSDALKQFHHIKESADPNIGLSYQWDCVSQDGPFIYHLHAECLLAEEHFFRQIQALSEMIAQDGNNPLNQILCNCGGGCQ